MATNRSHIPKSVRSVWRFKLILAGFGVFATACLPSNQPGHESPGRSAEDAGVAAEHSQPADGLGLSQSPGQNQSVTVGSAASISPSPGASVQSCGPAPGFTDVLSASRLGGTSIGYSVSWADIDNDGLIDLLINDWNDNLIYRNNGNGTFANITGSSGVNSGQGSFGSAWGDVNNDGFADVFIASQQTANKLFVNKGTMKFVNEAAKRGVEGSKIPLNSYGGVWGDCDGDGMAELFVSTYRDGSSGAGQPNALFKFDANGVAKDISEASGVKFLDPSDPTDDDEGTPIWVDYNNDGKLDLFIPMALRSTTRGNVLYRNSGNCKFTDVSSDSGLQLLGRKSNSAAFADFDNDGLLDVYLTDADRFGALMKNNGNATFTDVTAKAKLDFASWKGHRSVDWGDYDGDGYLDMYLTQWDGGKVGDRLIRNNRDGTFYDVTGAVVGTGNIELAWNAAWADYDNDGDLDLYVARYNKSDQLLRNNLKPGVGSYMKVIVKGVGGAYSQGGVRVDLYDGTVRISTRTMDGGGSGGYQHIRPIIFNNLSNAKRYSVQVRFSNGTKEIFDLGVPNSQLRELKQLSGRRGNL